MKQKRFNLIQLFIIVALFVIILLLLFMFAFYSINKKKETLAIQTIYSLVDGAKMLSAEQQFNDEMGQVVVHFENGIVDHPNYNVSVALPKSGTIHINNDGGVELKIWSEEIGKCAEQTMADSEFKFTETPEAECKIDVEIVCPTVTIMGKEIVSCDTMTNDPDGNLRYVGSNPNNYVKFNNELWRIIGIFNGQAKIIRNEFYSTSIQWDNNSLNDWNQASLNIELNGTYFDSIDEISKSYIDQEHVWNLGGYDDTYQVEGTRSNFYEAERSDTKSSVMTSSTWIGAIGLMYPSDYGYSTSAMDAECDSTVIYSWDRIGNVSNCKENSWLYNNSYVQWTLTSNINYSNYVFFVGVNGFLDYYLGSPYYTTGARPVLYLKSNVIISGGNGTEMEPFELSTI